MPRSSPWIDDYVVIRRRCRIEGKDTKQVIEIGTSVPDDDTLVVILSRALAKVLSGKFLRNEGLAIEFKEADD